MSGAQQASSSSRATQTATEVPTSESPVGSNGTLRLRGHRTDERRVAWTENTVDNEKLGRKSSKICCIYHKPRNFDESSSEDSSSSSDSDDTGDEHDRPVDRESKKRRLERKRSKSGREQSLDDDHTCDHGHEQKKTCSDGTRQGVPVERNAYEKGLN